MSGVVAYVGRVMASAETCWIELHHTFVLRVAAMQETRKGKEKAIHTSTLDDVC